uniref:phytol kinase n=1 Tax=Aureoumbra lagunensis TaxID=44058 RepID=A0A7S3NIY1_9STRA|mmetsp:Transcript_14969/g.22535  ORF Transcript_14969/g.22535 Transcript_14969/m.22535 type:complete len:295 (-) Transcript_14969:31-915(-)
MLLSVRVLLSISLLERGSGFLQSVHKVDSISLRGVNQVRRSRDLVEVRLGVELLGEVPRDVACSIGAAGGAAMWLKIWTTLASNGVINSRLSRKIIHCGSAPLFLFVWPFYSDAPSARLIAAIVPLLNLGRLLAAGVNANAKGPQELVTAVSRSGDPKEVLKGPLIYCIVLVFATLLWRNSTAAVVAISQMAVGDGVADIVGRRFGQSAKWPNSEKSYAGSLAFVFGASIATFVLLRWFEFMACLAPLPFDTVTLFARIFLISIVCALVELIPGLDDNISVPFVGAFLGTYVIK